MDVEGAEMEVEVEWAEVEGVRFVVKGWRCMLRG